MKGLIDGDVLVYSCGFASDAAAKKEGLEHEPLEFCLQGLKQTINRLTEDAACDSYTIFLSGAADWRNTVFPPYKENRDKDHRPHWYKEIREYLMKHHPVNISKELEADDEMGITQTEAKPFTTVIITKDKDLDMIPGLHYNFCKNRKEDGLYEIDERQALEFFYKQIISGDATDNIPGLFKMTGRRATAKIKSVIDTLPTEKEMYRYVVDCYEDQGVVDVVGQLLWIWRNRESGWQKPALV